MFTCRHQFGWWLSWPLRLFSSSLSFNDLICSSGLAIWTKFGGRKFSTRSCNYFNIFNCVFRHVGIINKKNETFLGKLKRFILDVHKWEMKNETWKKKQNLTKKWRSFSMCISKPVEVMIEATLKPIRGLNWNFNWFQLNFGFQN